jgi:NAD(P)-dependent dehydrogenase (short-subunit alcohol dehydrogenase family)
MSIVSKGVAIVTGGGQGIGRGIALRLARDGYNVAVNEVPSNADAARRVVEEISSEGKVSGMVALGDVSKEEDVKGIVTKAVEKFGRLNVVSVFVLHSCQIRPRILMETVFKQMVANAGTCRFGTILTSTWYDLLRKVVQLKPRLSATTDEYDRIMAINSRGVFLCYKYAAEQMIKQGKGGRIIGTFHSLYFNIISSSMA